jgi:AraC-like DNA-binding protein
MNGYYLIIAAAALHGFLLAVTIRNAGNNKKSLNWLSALLLVTSACLAGRLFYDDQLFRQHPKIAIASDLILFAYGPCVFLYLKSVFFEETRKPHRVLLHFIPFVLHLIYVSWFLWIADEQIFIRLSNVFYQRVGHATEILGWLHIFTYLTVFFLIFRRYPEKAKAMVSNMPDIRFFQYFLILNVLTLLCWATGYYLRISGGDARFILLSYNFIWLLLTSSVYMTGYFAIVCPQIFRVGFEGLIQKEESGFKLKEETESLEEIPYYTEMPVPENRSILSGQTMKWATGEGNRFEMEAIIPGKKIRVPDKEVIETADKLEFFMKKEKPYLDPNLTLPLLSEKIPCTLHLLSKAINGHFHKNFFDYINAYRVAYFMDLARQPESKRYTILYLAFESGFNSKSTFNHSFRKATGKTPSQFIKEIALAS